MKKEQLRQKIQAVTLKTQKILIPEWGEEVILKELKGSDYVSAAQNALNGEELNRNQFFIYAIIESVFTLEDEKVFTLDDFELVSSLPANVYTVLINTISKLNNLENPKN